MSRVFGVRISAIIFVWLVCSFGGCAAPKPTLVVVVGGLGFSQLGDLRHALEKQCPNAKVVSAGGIDAYKADIKSMASSKKHQNVILVGHSFGCPAIARAAEQLPKVDLAVFIDPSWDDFKLPKTVNRSLWYKRSGFGIEREARIIGAPPPKTIRGGHNDIPHAQELIASVVQAINETKVKNGTPGKPVPVQKSGNSRIADASSPRR